ncbi:MAG: hypothetical protein WBA66_09815 [Xanthobacteraceae bacterium]
MRVLCSAAIVVGAAATALADDGPTIVVPNRAVAPIVINGCDASYAVVESDWGLGKNVRLAPTVYGCRAPIVREVGHYFPSGGRVPGYGRLEVEPPANRRLPPQAESYSRSWSAQSAPPAAQPVVPMNPPEVIIAPRDGDPRLRSRF